ncbi:MAG TPA: NAD-dependent epimerase/dehydratase family protein [Gaiellaceae bacterium]|nr:NAD-dependent epimerase/dehydratase family protein [Gaiellaceae bacterium]
MSTSAYAGKRVLVTGGLGFIGSNLAIRLVELGAEVTVADSLVPDLGGNRFNIAPVEDRLRLSTTDVREGAAELVDGQEVVFCIAGNVSHVDSMTHPFGDLELNYGAQLAVLEALRRQRSRARIVYAGSRQQYGRPRYLPLDEHHPLEAVDVNGINKTAAEAATLLYHRVHGLATCSLRLTNTYGPRMQMRHPRQGFVAWFVRLAVEGREIELYGGGESLRDFNEVGDVVEAFLLAGTAEAAVGEVFNLGHAEPVTIRQFAETLVDVAGSGSLAERPFPDDRARIDIGSVFANYGKIRGVLGWEPRVGLHDGLARMVDYYRAHREHYW